MATHLRNIFGTAVMFLTLAANSPSFGSENAMEFKPSRLTASDGSIFELRLTMKADWLPNKTVDYLTLHKNLADGWELVAYLTAPVRRDSRYDLVQVVAEGAELGVLIREDQSILHGRSREGIVYDYTYYLLSSQPDASLAPVGCHRVPDPPEFLSKHAVLAADGLHWLVNAKLFHEAPWPWEVHLESTRKLVARMQGDQGEVVRRFEHRIASVVLDGEVATVPWGRLDGFFYRDGDVEKFVQMIRTLSADPTYQGTFTAERVGRLGGFEKVKTLLRPHFRDGKELEDFVESLRKFRQMEIDAAAAWDAGTAEREAAERKAALAKAEEERRKQEEARQAYERFVRERYRREEEHAKRYREEKARLEKEREEMFAE